jgi:WG containing repeat
MVLNDIPRSSRNGRLCLFRGAIAPLLAAVLLVCVAGMGQTCPPSYSRWTIPPPPPDSELERALKNEPLRPAQLKDKWGYIDPSGNFLIPPQFDCAEPFVDGVAIVELKKRFGYIGTDGRYLINPKYFLGWAVPRRVRMGRDRETVVSTGTQQ